MRLGFEHQTRFLKRQLSLVSMDQERSLVSGGVSSIEPVKCSRAGCEKGAPLFSLKSRCKFLESITFRDFGSTGIPEFDHQPTGDKGTP